jgi:hypothetical protein
LLALAGLSLTYKTVPAFKGGTFVNKSETKKLELNQDKSYFLIDLMDTEQYPRVGYWESNNGVLTLHFTGYEIAKLSTLDINYTGCSRIKKQAIASYTYKVKGNKLVKFSKSGAKLEVYTQQK